MSPFPEALQRWRKARRFSQLDLAGEAGVSARHIAFLETGRARPSASMVARLGDALGLPLAARNQMLTLAGFAVRYPGRAWDAAEMAPMRAAVDHVLARHAPWPALAVDRLWRVTAMNAPARVLFGSLGVGEGSSLLDLMLSDLLPPRIENWPAVAHHAAQRLRAESAAQGGVAALDHAADVLARVPGASEAPAGPVVPTVFRMGDVRLALFAILARFGTPDDVTIDDVQIELYFPADDASAAALQALAPTAPLA
jgi:transcriptional regulator with XRE-family HTH domain